MVFNKGKTYKITEERRNRTTMSQLQSAVLKKYFRLNMFPSTEVREELAKMLEMRPRTVQVWFQNQRQKFRNQKVYGDGLDILAEAALIVIEREAYQNSKKDKRKMGNNIDQIKFS